MLSCLRSVAPLAAVVLACLPASVAAQQAPAGVPGMQPISVCGLQAAPPLAQPPAGSGPVVLAINTCFDKQGGTSLIEPQTYVYYIKTKSSTPSQALWIPYDEEAEKTIHDDFQRLLATTFLDDLSIETEDYQFPNGTIGKVVVYHMEERQRIKLGPDYVGTKAIETSKIDEKLKEQNAEIRLDSFIDAGLVKKVAGIVRDMMKEKGFEYAEVTPEIKEVPGGPKLVHLTYRIDEGPTVKIRKITFVGNKAISSGALKKQMKETKAHWMFSFINGRGTYQEAKFDEDAQKVVEHYQDQGYIKAVVGVPQVKTVERFEGQEDAVDRAPHSGHRRPAVQGRHVRHRGKHGRDQRLSEAAVQDRARRVLQPEERAEGHRQGPRSLRGGRLLRVHRISRLQVQRRSGSAARRGARGAGGGRSAAAGAGRSADRQRDDADGRGAAGTLSTASRSSATRRPTTR